MEKSGEPARLAAIECKMEELGTPLTKLMAERLQTIDRRREKEVASDQTKKRVEPEVSNSPATKGGQVAAMECQTVEKRKKKRKTPAENQLVKITLGSGARILSIALERKS